MIIRQAIVEDCEHISHLAYRSKAHWGYAEDFLEQCKDALTVTSPYLEQHIVYVLERYDEIVAYYSFSVEEKKLDALFVDPDYIGQGCGQQLWADLLSRVKALQVTEFTLDADPHAETFYIKMGAKRIGEIASTVFPDRKLPLMHVEVQ